MVFSMNNSSVEQVLSGKTAFVTGASRGIGAAIAKQLAAAGATVVGSATTEAGAEAIQECLGAGHHGVALNVAESDSVDAALETIESRCGTVDILVNNAGITRDQLMLRMTPEDWDAVINTNLTGVYRVTRGVLRGMVKARQGRIISIASIVGVSGNPGQANYAAAKAGILGFTRSLAQEVAARNITVNAVAPGFIATDMTDALNDKQRNAVIDRIPARRLGAAEDIAAAVAYLASPSAAYVTGITLNVNGGMHMM